MKYYRIRATSLSVYYAHINSDDHPDVFDEEGKPLETNLIDNYKGEYKIIPDFDLYNETFPYGIEPVSSDWEFTDYEEISKQEYVNGVIDEDKFVGFSDYANDIPREPNPNDTPELREQIAENMIERMTMEDLMENYKYYLNKDWDSNWGMYEQDYNNYLNTEE